MNKPFSAPRAQSAKKTGLLASAIVRTVDFCTAHPWLVIILAVLVTVASAVYAARNFAISTDITKLISSELPFRQREKAFLAAFPEHEALTLVVVQAPTAELVKQATDKLTQELSRQPKVIRSARQLGGSLFFRQNGLLFLSTEEVGRTTGQLTAATPLIGRLAADMSFRGVMEGLLFGVNAVRGGQLKLDDLARPLNQAADTFEDVLAGRFASFSWGVLMSGKPAEAGELRRLIAVQPVLDFSALEPGAAASDAIRLTALDLNLAADYRATVRLTGPVPMGDEEFATLKDGALLNGVLTIAAVLLILWLALRSAKIIGAVFLSLVAGLAMTAAFGLWMVGALNLISVAFAVLFIGLGVDFGIQFSVRYRAERHEFDQLRPALRKAGAAVGAPLTLAAAATAAGFLSFLPTDYRGLSELGQIAGAGMIIAFLTSITVLPALLKLFNPAGEPEPLGYRALAPVDRFLERHRVPIIVGTGLVAVTGLPLLFQLQFDFNPVNLRSATVESVSTYLELRKDPDIGANFISIVTPSLAEATSVAAQLASLPAVARVMTLNHFIPAEQPQKLFLIRSAAQALNPALNPRNVTRAPSEEENLRAIRAASDGLAQAAGSQTGSGAAAAKRLSAALAQLAKADFALRAKAEAAIIPPLKSALDDLRHYLRARPVTRQTLPLDIARDWVTADGRARVDVLPKGDPNDNETLRQFARTVLAIAPAATGMPVSLQESGRTIVSAFLQAGFWALFSIAILLWIVLRRFSDVLLTLVPLVLAGVVTLEICVLIGLPLNFANIIALPLLLGVGVAFKIYYIMAWRAGQTELLQSSLTRAVIFSALTTATAFGSLWFSNHPGTSSMGKLLALSLLCTLAAAVLFQPALMGRPREIE